MDSIYTQCSNAARRLAEDAEPFSDSDVVQTAARDGWAEGDFMEAERHAPQVLATLYRSSRLVRFGTVDPSVAPLTGEADYVRKDGSILYGNASVWEDRKLKTPNGDFDPIRYRHDPLFKTGRRRSSQRNDFIPWADQVPQPEQKMDASTLRRDNRHLRASLATAHARIDALTRECERLRSASAAANGRTRRSAKAEASASH